MSLDAFQFYGVEAQSKGRFGMGLLLPPWILPDEGLETGETAVRIPAGKKGTRRTLTLYEQILTDEEAAELLEKGFKQSLAVTENYIMVTGLNFRVPIGVLNLQNCYITYRHQDGKRAIVYKAVMEYTNDIEQSFLMMSPILFEQRPLYFYTTVI